MIKIHGTHDAQTIKQLETCVAAEDGALGVLCADGHVGYSMPIGGVVAYRNFLSPSGVGYDIACGNKAVRTDLLMADIEADLPSFADEIQRRISFGIGRVNNEKVDHPVLDDIRSAAVLEQRGLAQLAANQLGTVGSGNHYVDVLEDEAGFVWVACHFGSRGFGHKTASMFMNAAKGLPMLGQSHDGEMFSPPLLLDVREGLGQAYLEAMTLAGDYAYAGRDLVVDKVLEILGARNTWSVHNHHNYAWQEDGRWVVRKGSTPLFPYQMGFVGGSMDDISVVLQGIDSPAAADALHSTVHGAGRVMSRNQAIKGKHEWVCEGKIEANCMGTAMSYPQPQYPPPKDMKCVRCRGPLVKRYLSEPIDFRAVQDRVKSHGVILRGAGADESPEVYRPLSSVLDAHAGTFKIAQTLRPRIVVMAGKDVKDPYKD
jgi:tRNA-splicing ligase RtcB (3'-phosphate/5'-hydroxy nucleic acid ligase)